MKPLKGCFLLVLAGMVRVTRWALGDRRGFTTLLGRAADAFRAPWGAPGPDLAGRESR